MATGDVVKTERIDRYHVEIRHPEGDWNHIHHPNWERTTLLDLADHYAGAVKADHPGSEVRIVRTTTSLVTTLATGKSREIDLGTEVVNR